MYVYLIIDKHEKVVKGLKDFSFIMYSVHLRASLSLSALQQFTVLSSSLNKLFPLVKIKKARTMSKGDDFCTGC